MTSHRFATVLALSDHAAGNRRQATALAQALRTDAHHAEVAFPRLTRNRCRVSHRWGQKATPTCDVRRRYQYWLD